MNKTPTTLIIMDGFGLSNDTVGNAVRAANTPVLDGLFAEYAHTTLQASGLDVGLPAGQMGNSEVGHTNIGGGRVSVTLLGESMTAMQVIGGALILGFTLLNELSPVPKAKKE